MIRLPNWTSRPDQPTTFTFPTGPKRHPPGHVDTEQVATEKAVLIQHVANQFRDKYQLDVDIITADGENVDNKKERSKIALQNIQNTINQWHTQDSKFTWTQEEWAIIESITKSVDTAVARMYEGTYWG